MRVMVVVTHLLGAGHLRRALNLAQAFARAQHDVTLVTGGMPITQFPAGNIAMVQLPPVRSDGVNFRRLLGSGEDEVTEDYLADRQKLLVDTALNTRPEIIITELFPFGRRILRSEFSALLQTVSSLPQRPVVLGSVRDILSAPSTTAKALESEQIVHSFYDAILVHSDEATTPLNLSWPVSAELSEKLRYTGYVSQRVPESTSTTAESTDVIVSAGGGSVGIHLFETAISAAATLNELNWRILVGGVNAADEVGRLQTLVSASSRVVIELVRQDFRQLLIQAQCSISMCGYNTAIDLLQTGTPGVLIPFDEGGESEQRLRAQSLSHRAAFEHLPAGDLSPQTLVQAVQAVRLAGRFTPAITGFDGADESVRIATSLARSRAGC